MNESGISNAVTSVCIEVSELLTTTFDIEIFRRERKAASEWKEKQKTKTEPRNP